MDAVNSEMTAKPTKGMKCCDISCMLLIASSCHLAVDMDMGRRVNTRIHEEPNHTQITASPTHSGYHAALLEYMPGKK